MSAATLTFLFSDIEGSTGLLATLGAERYGELLERQAGTLAGDGCFFVFTSASEAVRAAVGAQSELAALHWPENVTVKVRIGIHTGEATTAGGRYLGIAVHRAARICAAAGGGQVLVSAGRRSRRPAARARPRRSRRARAQGARRS